MSWLNKSSMDTCDASSSFLGIRGILPENLRARIPGGCELVIGGGGATGLCGLRMEETRIAGLGGLTEVGAGVGGGMEGGGVLDVFGFVCLGGKAAFPLSFDLVFVLLPTDTKGGLVTAGADDGDLLERVFIRVDSFSFSIDVSPFSNVSSPSIPVVSISAKPGNGVETGRIVVLAGVSALSATFLFYEKESMKHRPCENMQLNLPLLAPTENFPFSAKPKLKLKRITWF